MPEYKWPKRGSTSLLGTDQDRLDGVEKATGAAKYAYDMTPDRMLIAKGLGCPHAHCKIKSINTSAADKIPGVAGVYPMKKVGDEIRWQGDLIAAVAGETEGAAAEGVAAIQVEYEMLDVFVQDDNLEAAEKAGRAKAGGKKVDLGKAEPPAGADAAEFENKEIERLLKECDVTFEGQYGVPVITHMCLEPHGSTCEWEGGKLLAHLSTQAVSTTPGQFAQPLGLTAGDVTVHCDFVGGGFGSKFQVDPWGVMAAQIAKDLGRPVKFMLDRDIELKSAGNRPSGFIKVRLGATKDGFVKVWDSTHWGTSGPTGGGVAQTVVPYVFLPAWHRVQQITIATDAGPQRAWRAPNHPQACALTQPAYDDLAAKLGLDSYDVFARNLETVSPKKGEASMAETYRRQMDKAAQLIGWKSKWHPHGKGQAQGSVVTGLGMALHTWGGAAGASTCNLKVHPDGGVETFLGSQDLGTGTRTVIAMVIAETLGLPISAVKVNIGSSRYPSSGPSGGSTTVGGVSASNRMAALDALEKIAALVAKKLGVDAATLEAKDGRIRVASSPDKGLSWKEACGLLGMSPLEVTGNYARGNPTTLVHSQVGGVQMAEVAVDRDTGVVKMKKFVAVQDVGLLINRQTADSQIYGALIMGIAAALFEERIMDPKTGAFLNCELADYKLPRLGDICELVVEIDQPDSEYERGVVGLGEPPVISPQTAISNAVANALGVRVPVFPLTPMRVLKALGKA